MWQQCPRFRAQAQMFFFASIGFEFSTPLIWLRSAAVMYPTHRVWFSSIYQPAPHILARQKV
jgi:hypothetical protein